MKILVVGGGGREHAIIRALKKYDYLSRYLLDFSLRSDESSKFGPGNKRGTFPALSLAWRVNQEPFMEIGRASCRERV